MTNLFVIDSIDVLPKPADKVNFLETIAEVHLLRYNTTRIINVFLRQTSVYHAKQMQSDMRIAKCDCTH